CASRTLYAVSALFSVFFSATRRLPTSTLFPYTTLFRSFHRRGSPIRSIRVDCRRNARSRIIFRIYQSIRCKRSLARFKRVKGDKDRKSTRLNSSHVSISYAVFCLKKKKIKKTHRSIEQ